MEVIHSKDDIAVGGKESALVFQAEGKGKFTDIEKNPELLHELTQIGLTPDDFRHLISGTFEDIAEPLDEVLPFGDIEEHVRVRTTKIYEQRVEVSHCFREKASTQPPSTVDLQLRQKAPAVKILVGLEGEGVLRLPQTIEPAGMMYIATEEGKDIPFKKDTIAIIHAPTGWSFDSSQEKFEYLYMSFPPYSESRDTTAEILRS
jgi:hypothetical protein